MNEKLSNKRVKGYLRAKGRKIVNGDDEEIILTGWGLGNWLLPEGYMWLSHTNTFDRPRRIEAVIRELAGDDYSKTFWEEFRKNYVTKEDIRLMAEQGYNSVRIPFSWRNLMEDEPGIKFKEDGFRLLDRCIDWCEEYGLYVFLDMHAAPGGQTGANIDDSIDDLPRLFLDEDCWEKGLALWKKIAERYKNRWIVGGYDLLNEPIRPKNEYGDYDYLVPKLIQFYEEATAAIRSVDKKHLLSIEGHHWATDPAVFKKRYDSNMVIHFHRYACLPDKSAFTEWLKISEALDLPLWLGETGENLNEWYTAIYPLAASFGIGYNLWPWKKMDCTNSPYSIKKPTDWGKLLDYTKGKKRPSSTEIISILDEYLQSMKVENCTYNKDVTNSVFRVPNCSVRATDFDECEEKGTSYSGVRQDSYEFDYRKGTGMFIKEDPTYIKKQRFYFDCMWDRFVLLLESGEFASYSINEVDENHTVSLEYTCKHPGLITLYQDQNNLTTLFVDSTDRKEVTTPVALLKANHSKIKVIVNEGSIELHRLYFK